LEQQMSELERAIESSKGSLEVIDTLREEFSEWLDEANDEGQKEALANVIGHLESLGREYKKRLQEAEAQLAGQQG
jgi:chromosome segregation ATPase